MSSTPFGGKEIECQKLQHLPKMSQLQRAEAEGPHPWICLGWWERGPGDVRLHADPDVPPAGSACEDLFPLSEQCGLVHSSPVENTASKRAYWVPWGRAPGPRRLWLCPGGASRHPQAWPGKPGPDLGPEPCGKGGVLDVVRSAGYPGSHVQSVLTADVTVNRC